MEELERSLAKYSGNVIKKYRKERGLTQKDLGELIGVSNTAVANYENGYRAPLQDTLFKIAEVFEISVNELFPKSKMNSLVSDIVSVSRKLVESRQQNVYTFAQNQLHEQNNTVDEQSTVYLVGQTAAGEPLEYGQLQPEQISVDVPKGADRALNVKGDSMEPLIKDGSIVFYKDQPTVENGEIAIVEIDGSEVTCKKFYFDGDKVILRSINHKYEDMIFDGGVRIIGKVILN